MSSPKKVFEHPNTLCFVNDFIKRLHQYNEEISDKNTLIQSFSKLLYRNYSSKDIELVKKFLKSKNGKLFDEKKHECSEKCKPYKYYFVNMFVKIYLPSCKKKLVKLHVKRKTKHTDEVFISEILIGQYVQSICPNNVDACIRYCSDVKHEIAFSNYVCGINWYNYFLPSKKSILKVCLNLLYCIKDIHSNHILHNDIKLDNLVLHKGTLDCKLIDFEHSNIIGMKDKRLNGGTISYSCLLLYSRMNRLSKSKITDLYSTIVCMFYLLLGNDQYYFNEGLNARQLLNMDYVSIYHLHIERCNHFKNKINGKISKELISHMTTILNITSFLEKSLLSYETYVLKLEELLIDEIKSLCI